MFRLIVSLLVLLLIVFGALFLLGSRAREVPQTRVEKAVSLDNLS